MADTVAEARRLRTARLNELAAMPHDVLTERTKLNETVEEMTGNDGLKYAVSTQVVVDDKKTGDLQAWVEVWCHDGIEWSPKLAGGGLLLPRSSPPDPWNDEDLPKRRRGLLGRLFGQPGSDG